MLQVKGLSCVRARRPLFGSLSFSVAAGELLQVVGANGSGKSTLLRCLLGLYTGYEGEIDWQLDQPPLYLGHKVGVKASLTVVENLRWFARLRDLRADDEAMRQALRALRLEGYGHLPCGRLSEGQRKRVALAQFLLCRNTCWIMDEPFSAIDAPGAELLTARMTDHLDSGGAIVLSSHQAVALDRRVKQVTLG